MGTKFGNTLGSVGLVGGMLYAMKNNKDTKGIVIYGLLFGIGGLLIGNSLTKFYET